MVHEAVAVILCGGDRPPEALLAALPADRVVIAADSGVDHALALGLVVDHLVGDLDSATPEGIAAATRQGATIHRHPAAKEATDLDLAFELAGRLGHRRVVLVGGTGGRLDHWLAGTLLLGAAHLRHLHIEAWTGSARIVALHGGRAADLAGRPGDPVTLLALGGTACGIVTDGLRFPLRSESLDAGSTRGVSNELVATEASVRLAQGTLLVIHVDGAGPADQPIAENRGA